MRLQVAKTSELDVDALRCMHRFLLEVFGDRFTTHDWQHCLGGAHVWLEDAEGLVAHAAVVERTLCCGERLLRSGYVEAVATREDVRHQGLGSRVMREIGRITGHYAIGALSTHSHEFYAPLGWETWRGPTWSASTAGLEHADAWIRTPDDDGDVMILRTPTSPPLDLWAPIACDLRAGDVW